MGIMNEQQHKRFFTEQKKLFKEQMSETFYDLADHQHSSTQFKNEKTNERWLGWLDAKFQEKSDA